MTPITLRHPEGYALGGLMTVISLIFTAFALFHPLAGIDIFVIMLSLSLAGFGFYSGASWKRLDETGICIHRPFSHRHWTWAQVLDLQIVPMDSYKGPKVGMIQFRLSGRATLMYLPYTKSTLTAVHAWYGQPDADSWGKPPERF